MIQAETIVRGTPGPMYGTPEWDSIHLSYITASRAAAICGVSEFAQPLDIYAEFTGAKKPFDGNEHTRRGHRYEPVIIGDYAEQAGVAIEYPVPLHFHPTISYLAASPDAEWADHSRGVEAKLTMSPKRAQHLGEEGSDQIGDDWMLQCQSQMDVMGWTEVDLAVLLFGRLRIYHVERSEDLIGLYHDAAAELWQRIQDRKPPEPNWTHPNSLRLINELYGLESGKWIELPKAIQAKWEQRDALTKQRKELEKQEDAIQAEVLFAMGEAEIAYGDGLTLTRKTIDVAERVQKAYSYTRLYARRK